MKKIKYLLFTLCIVLIQGKVMAASIGLSASSSSTRVGGSVTVNVSANGLAGKFSVTSSNPSVISGGTSGDWIEQSTKSYRFTAKSQGTATITVLAIDVADGAGNTFTGSKSITIQVGSGSGSSSSVEKSKNSYLNSLSIENATLNPVFTKDTLAYTVELEAGTTKANIHATAEDKKASVTGIGEVDVNEGDNNFEIKVTSESGASRVYNIKIIVKEFDPIEVKVGNKKYTIVRNIKNITPINGYEETTMKINGEEVPAFKNKITKYTLVALKDSEGNQNFFIYDKGKYTLYKEYTFNKIILYPMECKNIPKGYKKTTIKLKEDEVVAYKLNKNSNYSLIYGMNIETGKKHLYMYDKEEGTLQIYNDEIEQNLNKKIEEYQMFIAGLCGLATLLFLILIIVTIRNHKHHKKQKILKKEMKRKRKQQKKEWDNDDIDVSQIM